MARFEMNVFTKENYERNGNKFPENSYYFEDEEDVVKCFSDLILVSGDGSGIKKVEITLNWSKKGLF